MDSHRVTEKGALLACLIKAFPQTSRTRLKNYLGSGMIWVNGQPTSRFDSPVKPGDKIEIKRRPFKKRVSKVRLEFPIIYEDKDIIVIDKPAGLLTMATDKIKIKTAYYQLTDYVRSLDPFQKARIFIVHRIDRDASGLLVFAKTEQVKEILQKNWYKSEKKYFAVVEGVPKKQAGSIESYLIEDKFRRVYSTRKSSESKLSITHYQVIESYGPYALLDVTLKTGRKNQIRVHLSDLGHPILGDTKYGSKHNPIKRLGLHAYFLSFDHPITHEKKTFKTELPTRFSRNTVLGSGQFSEQLQKPVAQNKNRND